MSESTPAARKPSRRFTVWTPMASRLASDGMTWSTRTGVQCTSAPGNPDCETHAPNRAGDRPILGGSCRTEPQPRAPGHELSNDRIVRPATQGRHRRRAAALAGFIVSVLFVAPAALIGPGPASAADLGVPNRPSVPQIPSAQPRALPADSTNVRIDMTENDGNDVIVESLGGVSAPGVSD